jgi:hypothetical protein
MLFICTPVVVYKNIGLPAHLRVIYTRIPYIGEAMQAIYHEGVIFAPAWHEGCTGNSRPTAHDDLLRYAN